MKLPQRAIYWTICALISTGCASKTSRERMDEKNSSSKAHPAAYSTDAFYLDYRSPADRESKNSDFFYKHCKLVGRDNPAPNRSEWDCSTP